MKKTLFLLVAGLVLLTACAPAATPIKEIPLQQVHDAMPETPPQHPRLFLNDSQLPARMQTINASKELRVLHLATLKEADELITQKPVERIKTGKRLLSVSRKALGRLMTLSWAYRSTGDKKYLQRAEQEMLAIAAFSDWNPSHFLDVAEMTTAMAIGYDWLYHSLSETSRRTIRQAILEKGINPSLYKNKRPGWWISGENNWNQVCHAGITCGALAIMEDDPELAETIVHRSVNKVQIAMNEYEPDGAYPEGPGYWVYGTTFNVILLASLDSVIGTDFGLSGKNGFADCGQYLLHVTGPTGLFFNYPDSGSRQGFTPAVFWFAEKFNDPALTWHQQTIWQNAIKRKPKDLLRSRTAVFALLWASPKTTQPQALSKCFRGPNPVAMFRTSWDGDATFLAVKGGSPSVNHGHMDIGSFVIDAAGLRWAIDLGPESYNKIESRGMKLWGMHQNSERWKIFRYNNYSHNTLTVNDQFQQVKGYAPITRYSDDKDFPYTVIDMTSVYAGQLKQAVRGASLLPTGQILIQDELQADDTPTNIRWAMTTGAKVNIISDKTAILSQKKKNMQFQVVTNADVKLTTYSTAPRADYDAKNGNTCMIGFEVALKPHETAKIAVFMAVDDDKSPKLPKIQSIKNWPKASK